MVYPPAIMPRMFFSMMRVPRIVGLPPQIAGSTLTRSSIFAPPSPGSGLHLPSFDAAYQVFQQSVHCVPPHPALSPDGGEGCGGHSITWELGSHPSRAG